MAVVAFDEAVISREGTDTFLTYDGDATLVYIGRSDNADVTEQEKEIVLETLTVSPEIHLGLPRNPPRRRELGDGWWQIEVPYSHSGKQQNEQTEPRPAGSPSQFQFSFQSVSQRIRQSIKLIAQTGAGPGTVGQDEPIGWDGERVNGADILIPQASFSETHHFDLAEVDEALKFTWLRMVGKTNNATFRNAAAGELLLTRVTGSQQGGTPWEISFEFAFNENATETFYLYPPGQAGPPSQETLSVGGFELLDFGYEGAVAANQKINRLIWVKVHQVYKSGDYGTLGIPI